MRSMAIRWCGALLVAALIAAPSLAPAQDIYISGGAGGVLKTNSKLDSAGFDLDADHRIGPAGRFVIGLEFPDDYRFEPEFSYRSSDIDSISGTSASGTATAYALMLNLIKAFNITDSFSVFLGGGFGWAQVGYDGATPVGTAGGATTVDTKDSTLGYQGIAGIEHKLSDRLSLELSYRYFTVPDLTLTAANGTSISSDYDSHTVMLSLRYRFAEPPEPVEPREETAITPVPQRVVPAAPVRQAQPRVVEPAPAAPAPAEPPAAALRTYIVFFALNSSVLTSEANQVIASAAESARRERATKIVVTGHADRSGTNAYNLALSLRRAQHVRDALVRRGIAAGDITVRARGESDPLVETPDGVREPQNRRVEIVAE